MGKIIAALKSIIGTLEIELKIINNKKKERALITTEITQYEIISSAKELFEKFQTLLEKGAVDFVLNFLTSKVHP